MMMWYMINEYRRKCGFDSLLLEIGGIESFSGETMVLSLHGPPWIAQFSTSVFPEYRSPYVLSLRLVSGSGDGRQQMGRRADGTRRPDPRRGHRVQAGSFPEQGAPCARLCTHTPSACAVLVHHVQHRCSSVKGVQSVGIAF